MSPTATPLPTTTRPAKAGARPLTGGDTTDLTRLFKVLASPGRLQILHALTVHDELSVSDLATAADMSAQATSNQLQRLADQGFLASRRDGARVLYRIDDPCVPEILDRGLCLIGEAKRKAAVR